MEEVNLEQPNIEHELDNREALQPCAPTDLVEASKILDRFANVAELENAYKQLRAEFTKKSQRLGELEREFENAKVSAGAAENKPGEVQIPDTQMQNGYSKGSVGGVETKSDNTDKKPSISGELDSNTNSRIIEEYLVSLASSKTAPVVISHHGDMIVSHKDGEVQSINAITKVAENFFQRKEK